MLYIINVYHSSLRGPLEVSKLPAIIVSDTFLFAYVLFPVHHDRCV